MKKFAYLAGPILGCDEGTANDWRYKVAAALRAHDIIGISPLRCEPLIGEVYTASYPDPKFGTARAIGSKNLYDLRTCDLTFAYMPKLAPGARDSIGTILEIGAARENNKLIILVTDDPFLQAHPVMTTFTGWTLPTLEDGIDAVIGLLGGYTGGKNV